MDAVRQVPLRPASASPSNTFCWAASPTARARPRGRAPGAPHRPAAKVNLIAWNPGPGIAYAMPQPEPSRAFRATLAGEGIPAYLRQPRGRDIYAACGQLKRTRRPRGSRRGAPRSLRWQSRRRCSARPAPRCARCRARSAMRPRPRSGPASPAKTARVHQRVIEDGRACARRCARCALRRSGSRLSLACVIRLQM
jgi:hypothetical protein